jgi:hypothetical protein
MKNTNLNQDKDKIQSSTNDDASKFQNTPPNTNDMGTTNNNSPDEDDLDFFDTNQTAYGTPNTEDNVYTKDYSISRGQATRYFTDASFKDDDSDYMDEY